MGAASSSSMQKLGIGTIAAVAIPFLILVLAAIAGNMIQHRLVWSAESLKPKLSKISPAAGFKRLFSKIALANFVKGLIKLALVGAIMAVILWPKRHQLDGLVTMDPAVVLLLTRTLSLDVLGAVVAVLAIIAAADYLFQYRQWYERQKMSLRELKEEFKQTEGDPHDQGQDPPAARRADEEAHDGGGAEGLGDHHQPDPLCGRAAVRSRHGRAGLRRQGPRQHRAQDPRGRRPSTTSRSSRTRRSPARCTPPSRSTRKSRPSTTRRWPR